MTLVHVVITFALCFSQTAVASVAPDVRFCICSQADRKIMLLFYTQERGPASGGSIVMLGHIHTTCSLFCKAFLVGSACGLSEFMPLRVRMSCVYCGSETQAEMVWSRCDKQAGCAYLVQHVPCTRIVYSKPRHNDQNSCGQDI